jgi:hypothetical protein
LNHGGNREQRGGKEDEGAATSFDFNSLRLCVKEFFSDNIEVIPFGHRALDSLRYFPPATLGTHGGIAARVTPVQSSTFIDSPTGIP